jgi:hypothetical protein
MSPSSAFPVAELPHDPLTKLSASLEPTAAAVRLLRRELYANARSVPTTLGGGQHGHLGLIMPVADYATMSNDPYVLPAFPDIPDYAGAATPAERAEWEALYKVDMKDYSEAHGLHMQLSKMFLAAVPHCYLHAHYDDIHGFSGASLRAMLTDIMDTYGAIDDDALEENLARLEAPWDPTTNIVEVFTRGALCRRFAAQGDEPIPDSKYMRILLQIFTNSGVFGRDIEDWEAKPKADKTIVNMKTHFMEANKRRRKKEQGLKGALSANAASNTMQLPPGWFYCWSHGLCNHTGAACTAPATGHVTTATFDALATHGGCTYIQRPQGYKPIWKPAEINRTRNNGRGRNRNSGKEQGKEADPTKQVEPEKTPVAPKTKNE